MLREHPLVTVGLGALAGAALAGTAVGVALGAGAGLAALGIVEFTRRKPHGAQFGAEDPFDLAVFGPEVDEDDFAGVRGPHRDSRFALFGDDAADAGQTPSDDAGAPADAGGGDSGGGGGGSGGGGGGGDSGGAPPDPGSPPAAAPPATPPAGAKPAPPTGSTRGAAGPSHVYAGGASHNAPLKFPASSYRKKH